MHSVLAATSGDVTKQGKAIALALGIGLGSLGAGIGIGNIFGSMIQSVARQPELRGELQGIMWLGFALTERSCSTACSAVSSGTRWSSDAARQLTADRGH